MFNVFKWFGVGEQDVVICEVCANAIATDGHHVIYRSAGGRNIPENLLLLCRECHSSFHNNDEDVESWLDYAADIPARKARIFKSQMEEL